MHSERISVAVNSTHSLGPGCLESLEQTETSEPNNRIRVVSALGRFGLGRVGQFLGWVVLALVGRSFRPIFGVSRFGPGSFRPKAIEINKV